MIIYLILLGLILLEGIIIFYYGKSNKNKNIYLILVFFQLFFVSAFRSPEIGVDTSMYYSFFSGLNYLSEYHIWNIYFEKGYILFNIIVNFIFNFNQSIIMITSLIILILITLFIKNNSRNLWLSVYFFITLMFFYNSINILRQFIAMAIVINSIYFVRKQKLVPFLLLIGLAYSFHTSALIFIIVYFFARMKFTLKKVLYSIFFAIGSFFVLFPIIQWVMLKLPRYSGYTKFFQSYELGNIINTLIYASILILSLIVNYYKKPILNNIGTNLDYKRSNENIFTFIILTATILSFLSIRMSILGRIVDYFSLFSIVFIPNVISCIKDKYLRLIVTFFIMCLTFAYNIFIFIYRPEWFGVTPYKFFW